MWIHVAISFNCNIQFYYKLKIELMNNCMISCLEYCLVAIKSFLSGKPTKEMKRCFVVFTSKKEGKNKSNKNLLMLIDGIENEDGTGRKMRDLRRSLERGLCQGAGLAFLMCWRTYVSLAKTLLLCQCTVIELMGRILFAYFYTVSIYFNLHCNSLLEDIGSFSYDFRHS